MSKKKDKKKKHKKSKEKQAPTEAAAHVLSVIKAMGKDAGLKKLFPKLLKKLTQEDIILSLNQLDHEGKIRIEQKGKITLLEKPQQSERKQSRVSSGTHSDFVFGTADIAKGGFGFVSVEGWERDIFIPQRGVRNAMQGDEVKVRITARGRRPEGEIVEIIKRSQDSFTGRIEVLEKFAFFIADEKKLKTDVFVPLTALNGATTDQRVIVRITDWRTGNKNPLGEVVEVLTNEVSSDYDMKLILIQNGFSIDFPHEVYRELEKYGEQVTEAQAKGRLDMRDVLTFTIDPEDAKDFDDAISVRKIENGNWEIGVHIADVSYFVREGTALDKEAEKRATSVYLPDRVCPMLPEKLSNVLCSLRPGEDKLTFSTLFEFDEKYSIKHVQIARTIIHSNRRFTYEEAQQVIETRQGDYAEEILLLNSIAQKLREKRFKKGAIAFEKEEVRFKLDEKGKPTGIVLKVRKDAHLLVEDFMLLANETVAKYGSRPVKGKNPLPFVYRIHDQPDPAKLEQFSAVASRFGYNIKFDSEKHVAETFNTILKKVEGRPEKHVIETLAIRSMAKAAYTTANIGHYGLAMEHYTHFTSPIRRYPDVLVHRLLNALLTGSDKIIDKEELEARCKNSSLMERKAMDAEREAVKYKQIEFLHDKIGEEFDGIISGVIAKGVFVEMIENKCEGMVSIEMLGDEDFTYDEKMIRLTGTRSRKRYELGDTIRVKILSADIQLRRIDLGLAKQIKLPK
ncbi:MAG: ribonuclease R [Chitinophagales bacterium]|nr:ribonuclease R [Chitinophagales bacterium]